SSNNRACVEGQYSALVAQGCPRGSEQKDFNVLLRRSRRRPNANLSAPTDLEVRNVFYPDKRSFVRVLKDDPPGVFRYWGKSGRNLYKDIALAAANRCWHAREWHCRICAPAAEFVNVGRRCAKIFLLRQCNSPLPNLSALNPADRSTLR